MDFDYGIIGGGPAGYTAGINLAKQGFSVILFEKDKIGGTCLNYGCIPTKALLHVSETFSEIKNAQNMGINVNNCNIDFNKIIAHKNNIVEKIRHNLELAVKNSKIKVAYSKAIIKDANTICSNEEIYHVKNIIVATGSKPKEIKGLETDHKFILNSNDILNLEKLPQKVLIIGSGAIGTEWARIFNNFGSDVNIVELAEHLIPVADIEISKRIERIFKQKDIKYYLKAFVENINNKKVLLNNGIEIEPDIILVATGREPLPFNKLDGITVIGDACNEIQLAHYAIHQAKEISLKIPFDRKLVPSVIYGTPEIAWVGVKEQDITEDFKKSTLPISALGKSWCDNSTDGFIKLLTKNDYIYGAHIISKEASSLLNSIIIAMQNKIKISKLKEICYAHPTYSEGIFDLICRI